MKARSIRIECFCIQANTFKLNYATSNLTKLSVLNVNIHSIRKCFNSLRIFLNNTKYKYSFIVLSEIWLDEAIDVGFELSGYRNLQVYRNRNGGGLKLYYIDTLNVNITDEFTGIFQQTHECLSIKSLMPDIGEVIITGFYRPPNKNVNLFIDWMEIFSSRFKYKIHLLCGDFNINILECSAKASVCRFNRMLLNNNYVNVHLLFSTQRVLHHGA